MQSHGSVGALVYHKEHDAVVIVRQFRPAVWAWSKLEADEAGQAESPLSAAFTYELCAGPILPALDFKLLSCHQAARLRHALALMARTAHALLTTCAGIIDKSKSLEEITVEEVSSRYCLPQTRHQTAYGI